MTTFEELFGIELPVIQAPMAGSQGSALAIAVSNAGGLGSLPCAMLSLDAMRRELVAIKAGTTKPFNVNFFCHPHSEPDAARDARWWKMLSPYFAEYGIEPDSVAAAPGRLPFSEQAAELLADF